MLKSLQRDMLRSFVLSLPIITKLVVNTIYCLDLQIILLPQALGIMKRVKGSGKPCICVSPEMASSELYKVAPQSGMVTNKHAQGLWNRKRTPCTILYYESLAEYLSANLHQEIKRLKPITFDFVNYYYSIKSHYSVQIFFP